MSKVKQKLEECKEVVREAKEIVLELLDEPMTIEQKNKILELYRLLK